MHPALGAARLDGVAANAAPGGHQTLGVGGHVLDADALHLDVSRPAQQVLAGFCTTHSGVVGGRAVAAGDDHRLAKVLPDGLQQEALLFAEQNGFSAPLTAGIKLRAKVVGGDVISKAFLAATNRVGLSLNYDSQQLTDYRVGCVGTAFRLYKQMGEPLYCETMRLIVAAWEGKPDSFRASVLKGMMHFVELYHGEFSEERLLRALRNIHPVDIYRIGQDDPAKLRGWKKYVFPIYTAYNGKCRKDALPMKF